MVKNNIEYWRVQGKKRKQWDNISAQWRDRKPSKEEARDLFKGIQNEYNSVRLIKVKNGEKEVLWEDKELLNQDIPIETVQD